MMNMLNPKYQNISKKLITSYTEVKNKKRDLHYSISIENINVNSHISIAAINFL